jgi:(2R)-sulfolactate sulfo-lyase subunit alpha
MMFSMSQSMPDFLAHEQGDAVAVAVRDIAPGPATISYLTGGRVEVDVLDNIALGHKVALVDVKSGVDVTEYGLRIGISTADIRKGQHVHVHNVRSARWQNSIA